MCTLSYIPYNESGYMLTHSRDESIKRRVAAPPVKRKLPNANLLMPVDMPSKGTWIAVADDGRAACLLNGGSKKHIPRPPYRHSRGLIIPEFFSHPDFETFVEDYDFDGLEPFTLIIFEKERIIQFVKDENDQQVILHSPDKPQLFVSKSLYSEGEQEDRKFRFLHWYYQQKNLSKSDLIKFHDNFNFKKYKGEKSPEARLLVNTVSTICYEVNTEKISVDYYDRTNDLTLFSDLQLRKTLPQEIEA